MNRAYRYIYIDISKCDSGRPVSGTHDKPCKARETFLPPCAALSSTSPDRAHPESPKSRAAEIIFRIASFFGESTPFLSRAENIIQITPPRSFNVPFTSSSRQIFISDRTVASAQNSVLSIHMLIFPKPHRFFRNPTKFRAIPGNFDSALDKIPRA